MSCVIKVKESNYGREHIIPSIIQLAFLLLESVEDGSSKSLGSSKSPDSLLGIEELAFQILKTMFEFQDMARSEVGSILQPNGCTRKMNNVISGRVSVQYFAPEEGV